MYNLHNTFQECVHSFHFFYSSTAEKDLQRKLSRYDKERVLERTVKEKVQETTHTMHKQIIYDKVIPNKHCQCITLNLLFLFFFFSKFCFFMIELHLLTWSQFLLCTFYFLNYFLVDGKLSSICNINSQGYSIFLCQEKK